MGVNVSNNSQPINKSSTQTMDEVYKSKNHSCHKVSCTIDEETMSKIISDVKKIPHPLKSNELLPYKKNVLSHIDMCIKMYFKYSNHSEFLLKTIIDLLSNDNYLYSMVCQAKVTNIIEYFSVLEKGILGSDRIAFDIIVSGNRFKNTTLCRRFQRRHHETIWNYGTRVTRMASYYAITYHLKYGKHFSQQYLEDKKKNVFLRGLANKDLRDNSNALLHNTFDELVELTYRMEVEGLSLQTLNNKFTRNSWVDPSTYQKSKRRRSFPNINPNFVISCNYCRRDDHTMENCLLKTTLDLCQAMKNILIR